jgi:putative spermidine/putrescine transport system permease protein
MADALVAFPLAYYMAKHSSPRMKTWLYIAVTLPLWSSYLVRVYAWKLILAKEGILSWFINLVGLDGVLNWVLRLPGIGGSSLSLSPLGMFIVFTYIWLPYDIANPNRPGARAGNHSSRPGDLGLNRPALSLCYIATWRSWGDCRVRIHFFVDLGDFIVLYRGNCVSSVNADTSPGNLEQYLHLRLFIVGPVIIMILYCFDRQKT